MNVRQLGFNPLFIIRVSGSSPSGYRIGFVRKHALNIGLFLCEFKFSRAPILIPNTE